MRCCGNVGSLSSRDRPEPARRAWPSRSSASTSADRGRTVQFHPAVTYEDFVVGLSPDPSSAGLNFRVKPGWLLQAAAEVQGAPYLLIVDEINRGDLGKVLGEAIYLFEPGEIGGEHARQVKLTHAVDGQTSFKMPANLFVLGTMNTADRSIANLDLAVRRRFAFVTLMPDPTPITLTSAREIFDLLVGVFVEHASDEMLHLLPGQSYFLASDEGVLRNRFRYDLLPLIDEYFGKVCWDPPAPTCTRCEGGLPTSRAFTRRNGCPLRVSEDGQADRWRPAASRASSAAGAVVSLRRQRARRRPRRGTFRRQRPGRVGPGLRVLLSLERGCVHSSGDYPSLREHRPWTRAQVTPERQGRRHPDSFRSNRSRGRRTCRLSSLRMAGCRIHPARDRLAFLARHPAQCPSCLAAGERSRRGSLLVPSSLVLRAMLEQIRRGFDFMEDMPTAPRGTIQWSQVPAHVAPRRAMAPGAVPLPRPRDRSALARRDSLDTGAVCSRNS